MKKLKTQDKYILNDDGVPVPEPDLMVWARWLQNSDDKRIVKQETINAKRVSTVFLGLDHSFHFTGPPVLWETMVFGENRKDLACDRCSGTREQAEAMHAKMVKKVKGGKL